MLPDRDLASGDLDPLGPRIPGSDLEVAAWVRSSRARGTDAIYEELSKPQSADRGSVAAVSDGDPAGDGASAAQDRLFTRVGLVDDIEPVGTGISPVERNGVRQLILASPQIDDDVAAHRGIDGANDASCPVNREEGLPFGPRVYIVAGGRNIEDCLLRNDLRCVPKNETQQSAQGQKRTQTLPQSSPPARGIDDVNGVIGRSAAPRRPRRARL